MANVQYAGREYPVLPSETVLDCLLRNGETIAHSCKAGACQSCLMRTSAWVPETAQNGFKDTLRAQGYFLACRWAPMVDVVVTAAGDDQMIDARISSLKLT